MTKLIIQIPCWNEELSIGHTLSVLPTSFPNIDSVETLIIDDGSSDNTVEAAQKAGAHHIVKLPRHIGLAGAFETGIRSALNLGADIIVNTDADDQYEASEINRLIQPILSKQADIVIGDRLASKLVFLTSWKRFLYLCADLVVSINVGAHSPDPTSGFRAMSSQFARGIKLRDKHSYTIETLIQAYLGGKKVMFIPIQSRLVKRPSRLIKNTGVYILKSTFSLFRSLIIYRPRAPRDALNSPNLANHGTNQCSV